MKLVDPIIAFQSEIQQIRRDLHAHPELCYEEKRTSDVVAAKLTEWGIPVIRGLGVTGVVGVIKNGSSTRAIGLRADMDALPMQEINTFPHASRHPGKMHACGHDGHTAMLLGAAKHLATQRNFDGTVYLIFQPAEEGGAGARRMIEDGLFEQCPMDAIYGMHNWPGIPSGHMSVTPGPQMASSNEFYLTVKGKGGHAAQPHKCIDPVIIGMQIAQSWQTIVSRRTNPIDTAVLSLTQFHAGTATNVIPDEAKLAGTVRTLSAKVLDMIEQQMEEVAVNTAAAFGAEVEFKFRRNYPPLVNHAEATRFAVEVMKSVVGADKVDDKTEPSMAAEDFAYFLQARPGCYIFIGNGEGDHRDGGHGLGPCVLHNGSYDFNDNLLPVGASFWVKLVEASLPPSP
ncbi:MULTISPECIES: M20 aminoacylase family protein [unclassified Duganella]|uniref:M20 aminoacylase family protein n=1 Tax=unclassified Duganella TaxID=2636909 RepID=UPI000890CE47|nr:MULTISPECIES: M20 aminoacylase family protein [unclassified Duganella]SDG13524.1 hippurate hydrolase [Duganella sp. OV458]SDJ34682.1 hippurate hydrolase [Duganella sp. OV510]